MVSAIFSGGGGRGNTRDRPTYPPGGITIPIVHRLSVHVCRLPLFICPPPPLFSSYPRTTPVLFKYVTTSATDFFLPLKHPIKPVKTSSGFGTLRGYYDMIFEV